MRTKTILLLLLLGSLGLRGQEVADTSRWQMHLSTGTTVATGFGQTQSLGWVAPSFSYQATDRLKLKAGFAYKGTLLSTHYRLRAYGPEDLAPRREGTQAGALWASAEYQANERLWLWASVAHLSGFAQLLWLDQSLPLQASAFSGGFAYKFNSGSVLEMHLHIVRDTYGSAFGLMYSPYYDPFVPSYTIYSAPWPF